MPSEHVLRVLRDESSAHGDSVLINVRVPDSESEDLVIEGTEGETPYIGAFSRHALAAARSSSSPIPADAWTATLQHLLQHGPLPPLPASAPILALTAELDPAKSLTLHLRQTVTGGISQRLGALRLAAAPDYEIDILAWAATAVIRGDEADSERRLESTRATALSERVSGLSEQLEALVQARKEGEDALIVAFADVLNAKKRKIRELLRHVEELQLEADKISRTGPNDNDSTHPTETEQRQREHQRQPGASRRGKRKANLTTDLPEEDVTNEAAQEDSVEEPRASDDGSEASGSFERMQTPGAERSLESTDAESGDEQDERLQPQPLAKRSLGKIGGSTKQLENTHVDDDGKSSCAATNAHEQSLRNDAPPSKPVQQAGSLLRRDLPYTRAREATQQLAAEDGGDETSDDEL